MLKIENPIKRTITEILNFLIFILFFPFILKKNKLPKKIEKILVLRPDHIGDVIMSTSVYREIKKKFPKSKLSVLVGKWGKEILENNPYIDEIIIHNCPWWEKVRGERSNYLQWAFSHFQRIIRKIRKEKFDIGIDLRGDFRHILFFLFCGRIKYKISYNRSGGEYLLEKAVNYDINDHEIEKNFKLLEEIGIKNVSFQNKKPEIFLLKEEKEKINSFFKENKIPENVFKIIVHPSAGNKLRMWGEENFIQMIKKISEKHRVIFFLIGSSKEKTMCERIKQKSGNNVYNMAGKFNIKETGALIEKSDVFIGNDSSMGHLASCFSIPSLILFGPNNPERCKPYNENLFLIYHKFSCSPCLQKYCIITGEMKSKCMENIKVNEVLDKFEKVIEGMEK